MTSKSESQWLIACHYNPFTGGEVPVARYAVTEIGLIGDAVGWIDAVWQWGQRVKDTFCQPLRWWYVSESGYQVLLRLPDQMSDKWARVPLEGLVRVEFITMYPSPQYA